MKKQFELDNFKKRTLNCLYEKKEDNYVYPIDDTDLLKIDSCPVCNSNNITLLTELYLQHKFSFFSTSVCGDCIFTFRSVSPGLEWFKKCWKIIAVDEPDVFNQEVEQIRKNRYLQYFQAVTRHINPSGLFLDIGAAYGTGAKIFQDGGFEVEVVEPEDNKRNYIEKVLGIKIAERTVEDLVKRKKSYDAVVMANCLEHVDNPINALSNIRKILNPNGVLYIDVPTLWNFVTWSDALFLTHKSYFVEENLKFILSKIGFEVLEQISVVHGKDDPVHPGFVLKSVKSKEIECEVNDDYSVEKVKQLYRKGLTFDFSTKSILKYNVKSIEHFYQTIKLDSKDIIEPLDHFSFIEFKPTTKVLI